MFYQKMSEAKQFLEAEIENVSHKLKVLPEGKFYCIQEKGHRKWYRLKDGSLTYMPKDEACDAGALAHYKYYTCRLRDLRRELVPVNAYLKNWRPDKQSADKLLTERSGYAELLQDVILPKNQALRQWMQQSFKQNTLHPENKIHKVNDHLLVRSKSEALIASQLQHYQIPFRYECALELSQGEVYPDFTIRHPVTGETYYWEHLGLLDNAEYRVRAGLKIHAYIENNIIPCHQLLITAEYQASPLTLVAVRELITTHFI